MARKLVKRDAVDIEKIMANCLEKVGAKVSKDKYKLFLRLFLSVISYYFFKSPDNIVDVGFIRLKKNPEKTQLFAVEILKDPEEGIVNAETLWRFYRGDLIGEKKLKEIVEGFVDELLIYAQAQETEIQQLTTKINKRSR